MVKTQSENWTLHLSFIYLYNSSIFSAASKVQKHIGHFIPSKNAHIWKSAVVISGYVVKFSLLDEKLYKNYSQDLLWSFAASLVTVGGFSCICGTADL